MRAPRKLLATLVARLLTLGAASAQTEITFWHAWGGSEGVAFEALVDEFNASQSAVRVRSPFVPIGDLQQEAHPILQASTVAVCSMAA